MSLLLKRLLICLVCHRITKMKLKLVNLFSFPINVLLSFSFFTAKRKLDENFLSFFEEKMQMLIKGAFKNNLRTKLMQ